MNIKQIAYSCGGRNIYPITTHPEDEEPIAVQFTKCQLLQFAQAVIAAYVAKQKPAAWTN